MSDVLIVRADARRIPLPDDSVQCMVTSPPYWGLRKYEGEQESVWPKAPAQPGDDVRCPLVGLDGDGRQTWDHEWQDETQRVEIRTGLGLEKLGNEYAGGGEKYSEAKTIGWTPTCLCRGQHGKTKPCLVLDPFGGSGTSGRVAVELNRHAVLLDISYGTVPSGAKTADGRDRVDYGTLAGKRTRHVQRRIPL